MKRLALMLVAAIVCAGLAGCAPMRTNPKRAAILEVKAITDQNRVRLYDESPDLILRAAERVLYESDHDYRAVAGAQTESTYRAMRTWVFTILLATNTGADYWGISAVKNEAGKTVVTAKCWSAATREGVIPVFGFDPGDAGEDYRLSPILYDLFFDRLDFMLGKRDDWRTCADAEREWDKMGPPVKVKGIDQTLFPLCSLANDAVPDHRL